MTKILSKLKTYWALFILVWILTTIFLGVRFPKMTANWILPVNFIGVGIFIIYFAVIRFFIKKDVYWFKKMVPRLFGSIIIGYIPLLMTGDMWKFCLNAHWCETLQIFIFGTGASWLYMFIEVNNKVHDKKIARKRAGQIILIGLAESLIIGLVLCSLFGNMTSNIEGKYTDGNFFPNLPKKINVPILFGILDSYLNKIGMPLVHIVYPPVLLTYFPLALFIGVFVQILWEDNPITEQL